MKSLRLFLVFSVYLSTTPAQFYTGMKSLGGSVSYTKQYYDKEETSSIFMLQPTISYFVQDNIAIVGSLNRITSKTDRYTSTLNGGGAGLKLFVQSTYLGIIYQAQKWEDSDRSSSDVLVETGYLYELSQHVFLDFGVDYLKGLQDMDKMEILTAGIGVATFF